MKVNIYNIKNNGKRKYAHFDKRLGLKEVYKYISNPANIAFTSSKVPPTATHNLLGYTCGLNS